MAKATFKDGQVVVADVRAADTFWKRFRGLMWDDSLQPDQGLWFPGENWIHCFFMKIPIDVLFLDKQGTIVYMKNRMKPWTVSPPVFQAKGVLECYPGTIDQCKLQVGQTIVIGH